MPFLPCPLTTCILLETEGKQTRDESMFGFDIDYGKCCECWEDYASGCSHFSSSASCFQAICTMGNCFSLGFATVYDSSMCHFLQMEMQCSLLFNKCTASVTDQPIMDTIHVKTTLMQQEAPFDIIPINPPLIF